MVTGDAYFVDLWRFAQTLRTGLSECRVSDQVIANHLDRLRHISSMAVAFDVAWYDPQDEHPTVGAFVETQIEILKLARKLKDNRKRVRKLTQIHLHISDFLYGHGRRFGYIHPSVPNPSEMWDMEESKVSFTRAFRSD